MLRVLKANIEAILDRLPVDAPNYRALDIGCGGQPFRHLFEAKGHQYVSADAQDPLGIIDHIMELDKDIPPALLERGPFDFILCTEVLEHVASWERAFENFAALLVRGGHLLITCPHVYVLHEQPYDFWRPTVHALRYYSDKYGFKVIRIEKLGDSWDVLGTLLGAGYDKLKPLHGGFVDRYSARLLNKMLKLIYRGLEQRWFQDRYALVNEDLPVYLSNLALLEKE